MVAFFGCVSLVIGAVMAGAVVGVVLVGLVLLALRGIRLLDYLAGCCLDALCGRDD